MNSRAADAYDESLKDVIEASVLEAQAQQQASARVRSPSAIASPAQEDDVPPPSKTTTTAAKKRKRTDDDACVVSLATD